MGYMGLGPVLSRQLRDRGNGEVVSKVGGAIGGGVIAASVSHPIDTVKTCMQGDIGREKFGTALQTASTLFREQGAGAFFRGWAWRTSRICIAVGLMGECRERLSPLLFPDHFAGVEMG